jgi:hypothetical protein
MKVLLFLSALFAIHPLSARAHSPEEEANEIREARLAEIRDRASVFALPIRVQGEAGLTDPTPAPSPVSLCPYVSWIAVPPPEMKVALTFDDGPAEATPYVLETLARYHAFATFFQIGLNAAITRGRTQIFTSSRRPTSWRN